MDLDKLKGWLLNELKYGKSLPSDEKLRSLSSGPLCDVWEHMILTCRSHETVRRVKGNLMVAKKKLLDNSSSVSSLSLTVMDGGERDELLLERSRLTTRLHEVLAKIERVESGIQSADEDRSKLHKNKDEYSRRIKEKRQSAELLSLYVKQVQGIISKLNTVVQSQNKVLKNLKEKERLTKEEAMFSVGSSVETEGDRYLRIGMEKALHHMNSVIEKSINKRSSFEIRREILSLLSNLPSSLLEKAVIKNIESQTNRILEMRKNLDLVEEARKLQLENTSVLDTGSLSSVREEVDLLYKKHISANHQLILAKKKLASVEQELETTLEANREHIGNMKEVRAEMDRSAEVGVEQWKEKELDRLKSLLQELRHSRENQEETLNGVRSAESSIQEMSDVISSLIESNTEGHQKLKYRQAVTEELVGSLTPTLQRIQAAINSSQDEPSEMLKTFLKVPVERYCSTLVEGRTESSLVPTQDLGIYRLRSLYPYPGGSRGTGDRFLASLDSRQDICSQVSNLISQLEQLNTDLQVTEGLGESSATLSSVEHLADTLRRSKLQQVQDLQPLLLETDAGRRQCMSACDSVGTALLEYQRQGIQLVVGRDLHWRVEERSLSQWQETLRVAVANTKS